MLHQLFVVGELVHQTLHNHGELGEALARPHLLVVDIPLDLLKAKFHSFKSVLELKIVTNELQVVVGNPLPEYGIVRRCRGMNHGDVPYALWISFIVQFFWMPEV